MTLGAPDFVEATGFSVKFDIYVKLHIYVKLNKLGKLDNSIRGPLSMKIIKIFFATFSIAVSISYADIAKASELHTSYGDGILIAKEDSTTKKPIKKKPKKPKKQNDKASEKSFLVGESSDGVPKDSGSDIQDHGKGHHFNYVYIESAGFAPAEYLVAGAKANATHAELGFRYANSSIKATGGTTSATISQSGPQLYAELTKPVNKLLSVGAEFENKSLRNEIKLSSEAAGDRISKSSVSETEISGFLAIHLTEIFDAGMKFSYHIESSQNEGFTSKTNYLTLTPSAGVHSDKFEGSFQFTPGVTAKGTATADGESLETEEKIPSVMALNGRYAVSPSLFAGGGFKTETGEKESSTTLSFEGGFKGPAVQAAGGLSIVTNKEEEADGTSSSSSQTGLSLEVAMLNEHKSPKFAAGFYFSPYSKKSESGTFSGSIFLIGASAALHF